MKKILLSVLAVIACLAFNACSSDDDGVAPSTGLDNLTYEAEPGYAVIRWDSLSAETSNIRYIKFMYYDPLTELDVMRTASVYADSILIPDMRKKYGDYVVTIIPVSPSGADGTTQTLTINCEAAPATYTATGEYTLTESMITTTVIETTEGSIAALVDGNEATYFHSPWSIAATEQPYLQIEFPEAQVGCVGWGFTTRNKRCVPNDVKLIGSMDGTTWFDIYTYTTEDGLPASSADVSSLHTTYTLGPTRLPSDNNEAIYFRLVVYGINTTDTDNSGQYPTFNMAELMWYTYEVYDPEA